MSHSTQNRSLGRHGSQPITWLVVRKFMTLKLER